MKTYNLTLEEAVGSEMAKKVRTSRGQTVIGTEHFEEECREIEPEYIKKLYSHWDIVQEGLYRNQQEGWE